MALAAVALMSSCDDFLTESPQSVYTTETFYSTDRDFQLAVNSVYQGLAEVLNAPGGSSWSSMYRWPSLRADEKSLYHSGNYYDDGAASFNDAESGLTKDNMWKYLYIIINRANCVLDRIDAHSFANATQQKELKGQALALRGWAYYQLGIYFGGVPLIVKEVPDSEIRQYGRSSQDETFAQAASDFKAAIALLPGKYTGEDVGRVGKYGAEAMLARMLMFQKKNGEAKAYLKDVIDNGGYALCANYEDAFSEAGEGNEERVWEVNYLANQNGYGQSFTEGLIPQNYSYDASNPWEDRKLACNGSSHAIGVNEDLIKAHEAGDVRLNEYITNIKTDKSLEYYFVTKFTHYTTFPSSGDMWGINLNLMRYADVLLMYAECVGEGEGSAILDQVRQRAGLGTWVGKYASFTEALRHERRIEFAFEGLRWFDLVRWGIHKEVMNQYFCTKEGGAKCETGATTGTPYYQFREGRELFAIPLTEIDLYNDESKMWQNPGFK